MKKKTIMKLIEKQQSLRDTAISECRNLNEEERREFDILQNLIDEIRQENGDGETEDSTVSDTGSNEPDLNNGRDADSNTISRADAAEITNMCRFYGVDAGDFFSRGLTVEQVRREIMERQMKENTPIASHLTVTSDENDKIRRAIADAIILRSGGTVKDPVNGANRYRAMSMREIAVECLERSHGGDYRHMDADRIYSEASRDFYNPESAFPSIMDDVIQKSYVEGLTKAHVSFDKWVKFGTLPNFKKTTNHEYIMSLGGTLERVPENGELKAYVPRDVAMPERQLDTYGRQFSMTRKAFIDDDIGLITTMPRRYAEMSMRTQNELVYSIMLNNKKIYDGKKMFSSDRKNTLATGTNITLEVMQKMIYMVGIQKDAANNQLALYPDIIIVPFGMGVEVKKILSTPAFYSAAGTETNPYYNSGFEVIEDVMLNGMVGEDDPIPWFMGVKGEIIQVDYLNGQREATIRRSERPGTLGFVWDAIIHKSICRRIKK